MASNLVPFNWKPCVDIASTQNHAAMNSEIAIANRSRPFRTLYIEKISNLWGIHQQFWRFLMTFSLFFISNWLWILKVISAQAYITTNVHHCYPAHQISYFALIGAFWPFLTTFGIESVTRWPKLFFRLLIYIKSPMEVLIVGVQFLESDI